MYLAHHELEGTVIEIHTIEAFTCTESLPFTSFTHAMPCSRCHLGSFLDSGLFILAPAPEPEARHIQQGYGRGNQCTLVVTLLPGANMAQHKREGRDLRSVLSLT